MKSIGFIGEYVEQERFAQHERKEFYRLKNKKKEISSQAHKHKMGFTHRKNGVILDGVFYSNKELQKALKSAKKGRLYKEY